MKAYMIYCDDPMEGCLLVFAETANKAKSVCCNSLFDWDYIDMSTKRAPRFDKYYVGGKFIIEENCDLPSSAPNFYNDIGL